MTNLTIALMEDRLGFLAEGFMNLITEFMEGGLAYKLVCDEGLPYTHGNYSAKMKFCSYLVQLGGRVFVIAGLSHAFSLYAAFNIDLLKN